MCIPGRAKPLLEKVSLTIEAGDVHGIRGESGTGKTTLLHTVSGLVPWHRPGRVQGLVEIAGEAVLDLDPGQRSHLVSTCLDRPGSQLFLRTPREELAAARRLHGSTPLWREIEQCLAIGPLMDRRSTELSSGERQRVALAVTLAASPRPALLDEPLAHLDDDATHGLVQLLSRIRETGGSVLLTEHAGWRLGEAVGRWSAVEKGSTHPCGPPQSPVVPSPAHEPGPSPVLSTRKLTVSRGGRRLIEHANIELRSGEIVLISGRNGSGKSTLAEVVCGLRKPAEGTVTRHGPTALMMPTAELQLFATSVAREVRSSAGREAEARVLRRHRLEHLAARPPWTLSRGERQRLVHAALDLQQPATMVVDEPAQGLGPDDLVRLVDLVHRRAARGRCYLIISHREELATAAHRHLRISDRRLVPC